MKKATNWYELKRTLEREFVEFVVFVAIFFNTRTQREKSLRNI
ncbi:MAG: hypothetical protein Q7J35_04655 [Candidatus Methanoperedens sp.]|nr:hypothetical protein [Candidatus Methanoperedens sp.]